MPLEYKTYKEAEERFTWSQVWDLFDGNRESFNIAHECVDRHAHRRKTALRVKFDDGHSEFHDFGELARSSSQFANMLQRHGVNTGDRVAIILNPSFEFYTTLFGTIKRGAAAVPCSPLFGPDALEYRIQHSGARALVTTQEKAEQLSTTPVANVFIVGEMFHELLSEEDEEYQVHTSADDVVVIQYTSGTTAKPKDVIYHHKSVPVSMPSAIFGLGLAEGEEFFCPSSPAWGHGIWYGTIAPLALGIAVGAYSGKFETELLLEALEEFKITNLSAAPTVYRRIASSDKLDDYDLKIRKMSYTGEPMDLETFHKLQKKFNASPCGFYGSTELGVIVLNYAGFEDFVVKPGALGKPMLGLEVAVIDEQDNKLPPGEIGEIAVKRRGEWVRSGDAGVVDGDGYFWHRGRVDEIIKSSAYRISPFEIEDVLKKHPTVREVAVLGIPDAARGQIVKAFIVASSKASEELTRELQEFVRNRMGKHLYPREIEFVDELPKTLDGKIKRKELKEREMSKLTVPRH